MRRLLPLGIVLIVGLVIAGLFWALFDFDFERQTTGSTAAPVAFSVRSTTDEVELPTPDLPLILNETWEDGIVVGTWKQFGEPLPALKPKLGRNESTAFDPNGDKNYESGVVSRFDLDLTQGAVIDFWAKGKTTGPYWQSTSVGISLGSTDDYQGTEGQPAPLIRSYVGAESDLKYIEYRLRTEYEREPYAPYDDTWQHYRIEIEPDGSVAFYRNGELQFAPDAKIDLDVHGQRPVMVEGRSWETDILIDDLRIYGTAIWPEALEIESSSPYFRAGLVLARALDSVSALAAGDFDGSGAVDIVAAANGASHQLLLWRDPGILGGFPRPAQVLGKSVAVIWRLAPADIDDDGDLDLVTAHGREEPHQVLLWLNPGMDSGEGHWPSVPLGEIDSEAVALAVGDLDDDGDLDIIAGTDAEEAFEIFSWENDGTPLDGLWTRHGLGATDDSVKSLALADLDHDGDLDLISGGRRDEDAEIIVWENDGTPFDAPWTPTDVGSEIGDTFALDVADLDRDGWQDIVSAGINRSEGEVKVWRNDGTPFDGPWAGQSAGSDEEAIRHIEVVDLDGDGVGELAGVGNARAGRVDIRLWQSDDPFAGSWSSRSLAELGETGRVLAVADLDGDGDADLVSGSHSMVVVWENNAPPAFD